MDALATKPSGTPVMESAWLIHTSAGPWGGQSANNGERRAAGQRGAPVLAASGAGHRAAQLLGEELGPVTDAQDGHSRRVDAGVDGRRPVGVDRLRPPRQDDALGAPGQQLRGRGVEADDLGVDARLAHPPGDQLRVLGAEVDDENGVGGVRSLRQPGSGRARHDAAFAQCPIPTPWERCRALPSVCSAGATITSAFWNSLTVSYPHVAMAVRRAPKRFMRPSFS